MRTWKNNMLRRLRMLFQLRNTHLIIEGPKAYLEESPVQSGLNRMPNI